MTQYYTMAIKDGSFVFTPVPEPPEHILLVPWVGQNVASCNTDDFSNNDCGPACLAMLLHWRMQPVTVDDVSKATGLIPGYAYTTPINLITAAQAFGVKLQRVLNLERSYMQAYIDRGFPVIVLVHYGTLKQRYDQRFKGGHWLIVTGYTPLEVIYNDPLWQDETGRGIHLPWVDFTQAMSDCRLDSNTPFQGLVIA